MAAGIAVIRANFDAEIGNAAAQTDGLLVNWHARNGYITGVGGGFAGIQAAPLSYTDVPGGSGDATRVFAGCADMEQLYQIYIGSQNLSVAKDFRANIKFLFGIGTH